MNTEFSVTMEVLGVVKMLFATVSLIFLCYLLALIRTIAWIPLRLSRFMRRQGYTGPPISWCFSNSKEIALLRMNSKAADDVGSQSRGNAIDHDIRPRVCPEFDVWAKRYGKRFVYCLEGGSVLLWCGNEPEVVKEILAKKPMSFRKRRWYLLDSLLGPYGMSYISDLEDWARQRRAVRPSFYPEKIKERVESTIVSAGKVWVENLRKLVRENGGSTELDMTEHLRFVTRDILAKFAFGIDFAKGQEGFDNQERLKNLELSRLRALGMTYSFLRWLPTRMNMEIRKTRRSVTKTLSSIIAERRKSARVEARYPFGIDLLGRILSEDDQSYHSEKQQSVQDHVHTNGRKPPKWTDEQLVDQCRTFFAAGPDIVASAMSWILVMLAHHTDWQEQIRHEAMEILGGNDVSNFEKLGKLTNITMFVLETLRLYPPAPNIHRQVAEDNTTLLGQPVPKSLIVHVDLLTLHRNPQIWGDDAHEFKPERFAHGISKACSHPYGYVPFGAGPKICVAQTQALIQLKMLSIMLLQRFRFRLSPSYRHQPIFTVLLEPAHGAQLILESLDNDSG